MILASLLRPLRSFRCVLLFSILIRIGLIIYSEWHDSRSVVKYTDIDYRVFSDAAHFLLNPGPENENVAQGPLKSLLGWKISLGNPYTRETYRYTPLLALLVSPNDWSHPSFGKYLFALCDIVNGILIYKLLVNVILPSSSHNAASQPPNKTEKHASGPQHKRDELSRTEIEALATTFSAIHLLNPMVFSISTRGSSESVLSLFVLMTLYASLTKRWDAAAIMLGVSTHWKIYPVVYGVACVSALSGGSVGSTSWHLSLVNQKTIRFALLSAFTFGILNVVCFLIWGHPFLEETYLYHLHRLDHRHNFSPYFYFTYLTYPPLVKQPLDSESLSSWNQLMRSPLTSFVPQMTLALGAGLYYGHRIDDLPFAWFVQTVVFVNFNKVCTSQYFLWYLLLLPLILPRFHVSRRQAFTYVGVWIALQAFWLGEAYRLEFLGEDVFLSLWMRGLVYVLGNCWVLVELMKAYS
ncbi:glycosyltransferase family 50 protein [Dendrothele bispora CBS 962.96]|uniref:GPI mannosyltransferase 1 n=1 Tax=Dendrothele bispora (strain CBS 962.96) TaxID=1314807 RepID=A0A4S8MU26_DENBC|nr:glycosyltransferase family 50 protein [Dendrothele bispora CBS 962.96]